MIKAFLLSFFVAASFPASAKWEMQLRADQYNPYMLPELTLMPNMDVACAEEGVAARFWINRDGMVTSAQTFLSDKNQLTSIEFPAKLIIGQPQIESAHSLIFSVNTQVSTRGIFRLTDEGTERIELPEFLMDSRSLTAPKPFLDGLLVRRFRKDGLYELYYRDELLLSEEDGYSHIFLPQVTGDRAVVLVSVGESDEVPVNNPMKVLEIFKSDGEIVVQPLLETEKGNANSPILSIDSSPQSMGPGETVFMGRHKSLGRGVFYWNLNTQKLKTLALESSDEISEIEYFASSVNSHGDVVFRAKNKSGERGVYWVNAKKSHPVAVRILGEAEELSTNDRLGSRVIQKPKWPAFSGRPCVTEGREIYVHTVLQSRDGRIHHGSGIFKQSVLTIQNQ